MKGQSNWEIARRWNLEPTDHAWDEVMGFAYDLIAEAVKHEPVAYVPGFYCGEKINLSRVKAGQKFVLVRTGQLYTKTKDGFWNESEQRPARLHLNCQVQIVKKKLAGKTDPGYRPNYGVTRVDAVNISQERVDETAKGAHAPVAWMTHSNDLQPLFHKTRASALNWQTQPTPLYTAPPKREWVGLTDEEINEMTSHTSLIRYFEAKLKEKNA